MVWPGHQYHHVALAMYKRLTKHKVLENDAEK